MALTTNLEGYWKLDGDSTDATGNGHTGSDTAMTYSATNAVINQAGTFNGSTSKIIIPNNAGFNGTTQASINGWFFATSSLTVTQTIFGKSDAGAGAYMYLRAASSGTGIVGASLNSDGNLSIESTSGALSLNTRYMVTVTYDGATLSLYVNAAKAATDKSIAGGTLTPGTGNVGIGVLGDFNNQFFKAGTIDEVGFWSRGLSSAEVTQLYNSGSGLAYPFGATTATVVTPQLLTLNVG